MDERLAVGDKHPLDDREEEVQYLGEVKRLKTGRVISLNEVAEENLEDTIARLAKSGNGNTTSQQQREGSKLRLANLTSERTDNGTDHSHHSGAVHAVSTNAATMHGDTEHRMQLDVDGRRATNTASTKASQASSEHIEPDDTGALTVSKMLWLRNKEMVAGIQSVHHPDPSKPEDVGCVYFAGRNKSDGPFYVLSLDGNTPYHTWRGGAGRRARFQSIDQELRCLEAFAFRRARPLEVNGVMSRPVKNDRGTLRDLTMLTYMECDKIDDGMEEIFAGFRAALRAKSEKEEEDRMRDHKFQSSDAIVFLLRHKFNTLRESKEVLMRTGQKYNLAVAGEVTEDTDHLCYVLMGLREEIFEAEPNRWPEDYDWEYFNPKEDQAARLRAEACGSEAVEGGGSDAMQGVEGSAEVSGGLLIL